MVSLTGYGGVNEIGGNKFVLEDGKTKILLDFGMSFGLAKRYLNEFLKPRKLNGIGDWVELGLLPDLKGIYRPDYLKHMGRPEEPLEYQALFITHAHADHASYTHFLRPDLPIYATPETLAIMKSTEETGTASMPNDLCTFTKAFEYVPYKDTGKKGMRRAKSNDPGMTIERPLHSPKEKVHLGDIEVEMPRVNHSLPGASALLLHTPRGTIAYTGDLRFHGYNGQQTEDFIRKAHGAKYLVLEGTRIDSEGEPLGEKEVSGQLSSIVRNTKGLVLANWPVRDTERLVSFHNAAKANDRILAISTKQAHLLEQLAAAGADVPKLNDPNLRIFLTRRSWGLLGSGAKPEEVEQDYRGSWEFPYLIHPNMVSYKEIRSEPHRYVVRADLFDMTELIDLQPPEGSVFIRSLVEPLDDEMEVAEKKLRNWLDHFKIKFFNDNTHCSGHAPLPDLRRIVDTVQPEFIIPVHTQKPRKFTQLGNVIYPKYGKAIEL